MDDPLSDWSNAPRFWSRVKERTGLLLALTHTLTTDLQSTWITTKA